MKELKELGARGIMRELLASVVVFLVALPLCLGIAMASGAPPALGLISGIIGGLVVGAIAGSPLQVSGPAAGLAVIVWELIQSYGLKGMAVAVLVAGVLQITASLFRLGSWFRAASPAVINGMLAGIGVLIFASQFHVMLDAEPAGDGIANLLAIPGSIAGRVLAPEGTQHQLAAFIGILTISVIMLWGRFRPKFLKAVPGPLVAVLLATLVTHVFWLPINLVTVPADLMAVIAPPTSEFNLLFNPAFVASAVGVALIASAESMLCATAVDRLHGGARTKYNRELLAQGVGNTLCGLLGALPVTGVIVRSSANVDAGAKTRLSAILHGVWILGLVALVPTLLRLIPTASLAAVLVYTGFKLAQPSLFKRFYKLGWGHFATLMATVLTIVAADLLTGVLVGLVFAALRGFWKLSHLDIHARNVDGTIDLELAGAATFLTLPKLMQTLEEIADELPVAVHIGDLMHIDHACLEALEAWGERRRGTVTLDWEHMRQRHDHRLGHMLKSRNSDKAIKAAS